MFIALKPCKFAGQTFLAGETIPDKLVHPSAVRRLKNQRFIVVPDEQKEVVEVPVEVKQLFTVPILADEGELSVELEPEELKTLFIVLQNNADKAGKLVAEQVNTDLLLCIHALDSRKTVKEAAKEKATALIAAENSAPDENAAELPENGSTELPENGENETNEQYL